MDNSDIYNCSYIYALKCVLYNFFLRYSPIEEESNSCKVISLYKDIEQILRSEEFNGDLRNELQNSNQISSLIYRGEVNVWRKPTF